MNQINSGKVSQLEIGGHNRGQSKGKGDCLHFGGSHASWSDVPPTGYLRFTIVISVESQYELYYTSNSFCFMETSMNNL